MIKILFSDLDGTLLFNNGSMTDTVTEKNEEAIIGMMTAGIKFGVATSRSPSFLSKLTKLNYQFDTVAYNGNLIVCNNDVIDKSVFKSDDIEILATLLDVHNPNNRISFITEKNDMIYYDLSNSCVNRYIQNELGLIQDHRRILDYNQWKTEDEMLNEICCIACVYCDKKSADYVRETIKSFNGSLSYLDTSSRTMIVGKNNRNKVSGILEIAQKYGIEEDEIAVIGDSINDIDMLRYFKHSFCMSHADKSVRDCASEVVEDVSKCIQKIMEYNHEKRI